MADEIFTIKCAGCGREIQVPAELSEFSCVYCGHKMHREPAVLPDDTASDFENAAAAMIPCIMDNLEIHSTFSKYTYTGTLDDFKNKYYPVFASLDRLLLTSPEHSIEMAAKAAVIFIDGIVTPPADAKRYKGAGNKGLFLYEVKLVMAVYLVPAVLDMNLESARTIINAIHREWCSRYPKDQFTVGTRAEIEGGFKKHLLCFITTAVCELDNKPDDCEELSLLRSFRDGYLSSAPDGRELIEEYYDMAPLILTCINLCDDRRACLSRLRDEFILPCVQDIKRGNMETCKNRYTTMMRGLERYYLNRQ